MDPMQFDLERAWQEWLVGLAPWEYHWVMRNELELHDQYMAGDISVANVEDMLKSAFASVRV